MIIKAKPVAQATGFLSFLYLYIPIKDEMIPANCAKIDVENGNRK